MASGQERTCPKPYQERAAAARRPRERRATWAAGCDSPTSCERPSGAASCAGAAAAASALRRSGRAAAASARPRSERVAAASAGASERRGEQGEELHGRGRGGRSQERLRVRSARSGAGLLGDERGATNRPSGGGERRAASSGGVRRAAAASSKQGPRRRPRSSQDRSRRGSGQEKPSRTNRNRIYRYSVLSQTDRLS